MAVFSCSIPHFNDGGIISVLVLLDFVIDLIIDVGSRFFLLFSILPKCDDVKRFILSLNQVGLFACIFEFIQISMACSFENPTNIFVLPLSSSRIKQSINELFSLLMFSKTL